MLTPDANLGNLGLDSLETVRLLVTLEETYEVVIPDDVLNHETFETPNSLWAVIESLFVPAREGVAERGKPANDAAGSIGSTQFEGVDVQYHGPNSVAMRPAELHWPTGA